MSMLLSSLGSFHNNLNFMGNSKQPLVSSSTLRTRCRTVQPNMLQMHVPSEQNLLFFCGSWELAVMFTTWPLVLQLKLCIWGSSISLSLTSFIIQLYSQKSMGNKSNIINRKKQYTYGILVESWDYYIWRNLSTPDTSYCFVVDKN